MSARQNLVQLLRLALCAALVGAAALVGLTAVASSAQADAPPERAEAFFADLCAGETSVDPTTSGGRNLTTVDGARLDAYNEGQLVPLYDYTGRVQSNASPPMCAVRYDANVGGPVSEWMFCTDIDLHSCNDLNDGWQLAHEGEQVEFPTAVDNRFTETQIDAINALLLNGYVTQTALGDVVGRADGTPGERLNLQYMVWCVSDGGPVCDAVAMDETDIATLAAQGAELDPTATLTAANAEVEIGDELRWSMDTNVIGVPITYTSDVALTVCADSAATATITGTTITVAGDPGTPATVDLCATAAEAGSPSLTVGREGQGTHFVQSETVLSDGVPCQVYAMYDVAAFTATAAIQVTDEPTDEPTTEDPTTDPATEDPTTDPATDPATTDPATTEDPATEETSSNGGSALAATGADGADLALPALVALLLLTSGALILTIRRHRAQG